MRNGWPENLFVFQPLKIQITYAGYDSFRIFCIRKTEISRLFDWFRPIPHGAQTLLRKDHDALHFLVAHAHILQNQIEHIMGICFFGSFHSSHSSIQQNVCIW